MPKPPPRPTFGRHAFADLISAPGQPFPEARRLPLARIDPNPFQTRHAFDETFLEALAEELRSGGRLLQPIRVRPRGDRFQIVNGEQRWRAAGMAGWTEIPAIVEDLSDEEADLATLLENVQRTEPDSEDMARHLARVQQQYSISERELARRLGRGRNWVNNHLRALRKRPDLLHRLALPEDDPARLTWPELLAQLPDEPAEGVTYDKSVSDVTYDKSPAAVEREVLDAEASAAQRGGPAAGTPPRPPAGAGPWRVRPVMQFRTWLERTQPMVVPPEERATVRAELEVIQKQLAAFVAALDKDAGT